MTPNDTESTVVSEVCGPHLNSQLSDDTLSETQPASQRTNSDNH